MANLKVALDYFPHIQPTRSMEMIGAEFQEKGYAIMWNIFEEIFMRGNGYFCEWNDDVALMFMQLPCISVGVNAVSEVLNAMFRRGILSIDRYKKYGILTSKYTQEVYFEAVKRRKNVAAIKEYLLINADKIPDNVNIISLNANINSKNVNINSQKKGKESKVNKSKINNICVPPSANAADDTDSNYFISLPLNDKTFYQVAMSDVQHYKELYPAVDVEQELRSMLGWLESNPANRKTRNGVKSFITKWLNKAQNQGGAGYGAIQRNNQQVHSERKMSRDYFKGGKIL